jgi:alkylation response protein AidB-like acyl-CoA dehydrogenase
MQLDEESYQLLKDSAKVWFANNASIGHFRELRDNQICVAGRDYWQSMAELGWSGIMVDEAFGGVGLGMREMGALLEQAGRGLSPSPLMSTGLIAVSALELCNSSQLAQLKLNEIAAGQVTVALAIEEGSHHNPTCVSTRAVRNGNQWRLSGRKTQVADASSADAFLITARCEDEGDIGLFWVDSDTVSIHPLHYIDSRDHGIVEFNDALLSSESLLAHGSDCNELLSRILDRAYIGISAEMLGNAWAAFWMTVDYLKIREQFGQLIGSFQALQHRAAKQYVELELAQTVVDAALKAVDDDLPDVPSLASMAKAVVGETLKHVTNETIQLHGGIGMTDEHDAGLFLKRARVAESLYGSTSYHQDRYATLRGF